MFCTKCGQKVEQNDTLCTNCGAKVLRPAAEKKENIVLAIIALVFSIISPCFGFLLGLVGVSVYNTPKFKDLSARAITVSVSIFIITVIVSVVFFSLLVSVPVL